MQHIIDYCTEQKSIDYISYCMFAPNTNINTKQQQQKQ